MEVLNVVYLLSYFCLNILLFKASLCKRILAVTFFWSYEFLGEFIALKVAYAITGELTILQLGSAFMNLSLVLMMVYSALFFYPLLWIWDKMRNVEWLMLLFPLSQFVLSSTYVVRCESIHSVVSFAAGLGMLLGVVGDCYMFSLFYLRERRKRVEHEIRNIRYLWERERIRYKELEERQKDSARIRHDFQNYLLMLQKITRENGEENQVLIRKVKEEVEKELKMM